MRGKKSFVSDSKTNQEILKLLYKSERPLYVKEISKKSGYKYSLSGYIENIELGGLLKEVKEMRKRNKKFYQITEEGRKIVNTINDVEKLIDERKTDISIIYITK